MASLEPHNMVHVYDNYESDPWESHEGEKEELNVQLISCPTLINEQMSLGISKPASILYPPVHAENIKQHVRNDEINEVTFYQFSMPYYKFYDPVRLYMELNFPKSLEPAKLFILSSFGAVLSVFQNMFSFCCHTSLTFYGSFAVKRRIMLPNCLGGYGGSLLWLGPNPREARGNKLGTRPRPDPKEKLVNERRTDG
jgi:hypothetical protein